jgi:hypothetical protein
LCRALFLKRVLKSDKGAPKRGSPANNQWGYHKKAGQHNTIKESKAAQPNCCAAFFIWAQDFIFSSFCQPAFSCCL